MYIKLCIDGMTSVPFSAKSLPIRFEKYNLRDEIVLKSREKYGMPKIEIEEKISKWSNQTYSERGNRSNMPQPKEMSIGAKKPFVNSEDKKLEKDSSLAPTEKPKEEVYSVKI